MCKCVKFLLQTRQLLKGGFEFEHSSTENYWNLVFGLRSDNHL